MNDKNVIVDYPHPWLQRIHVEGAPSGIYEYKFDPQGVNIATSASEAFTQFGTLADVLLKELREAQEHLVIAHNALMVLHRRIEKTSAQEERESSEMSGMSEMNEEQKAAADLIWDAVLQDLPRDTRIPAIESMLRETIREAYMKGLRTGEVIACKNSTSYRGDPAWDTREQREQALDRFYAYEKALIDIRRLVNGFSGDVPVPGHVIRGLKEILDKVKP